MALCSWRGHVERHQTNNARVQTQTQTYVSVCGCLSMSLFVCVCWSIMQEFNTNTNLCICLSAICICTYTQPNQRGRNNRRRRCRVIFLFKHVILKLIQCMSIQSIQEYEVGLFMFWTSFYWFKHVIVQVTERRTELITFYSYCSVVHWAVIAEQ